MRPDEQPTDQEKELRRMWQESVLPGPMDPGEMARSIASRIEKFDRRIKWRNLREYGAGAALFVFFIWIAQFPVLRLQAVAGLIAVGFVMTYLWRSQRQTPRLDPSADARSYQAALIQRYDHQIRLLRQVKYWYVLPLYSWMLLVLFTVPQPTRTLQIVYGAVMTGFAGFVVWLNESYAVGKLRSERKKAEQLIETREP